MILHIGQNEFVSRESIIMILDAKCAREQTGFLEEACAREQKMNPGGHFKSVILTETGICFSPVSAATLKKRAEEDEVIFHAESELR